MKKQTLAVIMFFVCFVGLAQSPQLINYQGVARNQVGDPITNPVGIRLEIIFGSPSATAVYSEQRTITPGIGGVFNTSIGSGPATLGNFSTINWGSGPHYLKVSLDTNGGTAFSPISTTQLLSVPYALYAEKAGNATSGATTNITAQGLVSLTNTATNYTLDVQPPSINYNNANQVLSLSQGSFVSTATITSPPATISIVGPGVTGGPSNYTISSTPSPTIFPSGIVSATNTAPGYTVHVPPPTLSYSPPTKVLTLMQGLAVTTATISVAQTTVSQGNNISVSGAAPSYTVSSPNYSISFPTNTVILLDNGLNSTTAAIPPQMASLTIGGPSANIISAGANSISIANYNAGNGLTKTGLFPNFIFSATSSGTNAVWSTLGNTATNPATNFIGTIDNNDLIFKVNNNRAGRIYSTNSLFFGINAGPAIPQGSFNVGFGENALASLIGSGTDNSAFGAWSLRNTTTGVGNVAAGSEALLSNTTGNANVGIGYRAGYSNATGTGNVYIGHEAGFFDTGSNKLIVSNTSTTISPLLYGDFGTNSLAIGKTAPTANLDVKGKTATDSIRISGPVVSQGAVLVSRDATGNAKWARPINFKGTFIPSTPVPVGAGYISNIGNTSGGYTSQTPLNNVPSGGVAFTASGMTFTVPEDGVYFLSAKIMVGINSSATGNIYIALEIFNQTTATVLERTMQSNPDNASVMNTVLAAETMAQLQKNQVIILRVNGSVGTSGSITNAFPLTDKMNTFQGFLVR